MGKLTGEEKNDKHLATLLHRVSLLCNSKIRVEENDHMLLQRICVTTQLGERFIVSGLIEKAFTIRIQFDDLA